MDLKTLTVEQLDEYRIAVINEQERRSRLATAADQVAEISRRFIEDGGDPAVMQEAINHIES